MPGHAPGAVHGTRAFRGRERIMIMPPSVLQVVTQLGGQ